MIEQLDEDERAAALDALDAWDYDEARDAFIVVQLFDHFCLGNKFAPLWP